MPCFGQSGYLRAKVAGHMVPQPRFPLLRKPADAYLVLTFFAPWKKKTTLPSQAELWIPYQVFCESSRVLAFVSA